MRKFKRAVWAVLWVPLFCIGIAQAQQFKTVSKAGTDPTALIIELKNGKVEKWKFADNPVVTFFDTVMHIKSDYAETDYLLGDLNKYYSSDSPGAASEKPESNTNFSFKYTDRDRIEIYGAGQVIVYELNGRPMLTQQAGADGLIQVDMQTFPTGIYILRTDSGKSIKIYRQ